MWQIGFPVVYVSWDVKFKNDFNEKQSRSLDEMRPLFDIILYLLYKHNLF